MIRFEPTLPIWLTCLLFIPLIILLIRQIIVVDRKRYDSSKFVWFRRLLMLLCLLSIAVAPALPQKQQEQIETNLSYIFAFDRTGSMSAVDGEDGVTRFKTAQSDHIALSNNLPLGKYSAVSLGPYASIDLPMTRDARAFRNWARAITPEITQYSNGTGLTRMVDPILEVAKNNHAKHPHDQTILFLFTDGEDNAQSNLEDFSALDDYIYGGYVIGYGTAVGAKMLEYSPNTSAKKYIINPKDNLTAVSHLHVDNLDQIAKQIGIQSIVRISNQTTQLIADNTFAKHYRKDGIVVNEVTYNLLIWPFEIAFLILIFWEMLSQLLLHYTNGKRR